MVIIFNRVDFCGDVIWQAWNPLHKTF